MSRGARSEMKCHLGLARDTATANAARFALVAPSQPTYTFPGHFFRRGFASVPFPPTTTLDTVVAYIVRAFI